MKKIISFLVLSFLTPFVFAFDYNAFQEKNTALSDTLTSKIEAQKEKQVSYKYNYEPVVFKIKTEYEENLYFFMGENYEDGSPVRAWIDIDKWDRFVNVECYATLLDKEHILTHSNCVSLESKFLSYDKKETDNPQDAEVEYKRIGFDIILGDRKVSLSEKTLSNKDKFEVFYDWKTDLVVIKIKELATMQTKPYGIGPKITEKMSKTKNASFDIKANYGIYVLSNIDAKDNVSEAFTTRVFYSPLQGERTVNSADDGKIILNGKVKESPLAEPVFHRVGDKTILVGVKTHVGEDLGHTETNKYMLFSSEFTKFLKENLKTPAVKLTKDLKANTVL